MGLFTGYYQSMMNSVGAEIDQYRNGLSYLDSASGKVEKLISSLKPCVNLIAENFLINSKVGDDNLTQEGVSSLESLSSSIEGVKGEINSKISKLEGEYKSWEAKYYNSLSEKDEKE